MSGEVVQCSQRFHQSRKACFTQSLVITALDSTLDVLAVGQRRQSLLGEYDDLAPAILRIVEALQYSLGLKSVDELLDGLLGNSHSLDEL